MGEMDKSRELYSREGDNSSRFEGKTVPWEHTKGHILDSWGLVCEDSGYVQSENNYATYTVFNNQCIATVTFGPQNQ